MSLRVRHYGDQRSHEKNFYPSFCLLLLVLIQGAPVSMEDIRPGDIGYMYHSPFVLAEMMHQVEDKNTESGFSRRKLNEFHIGRALLTKLAGEDDDFGEKDKQNVPNEPKSDDNTSRVKRGVQLYYEYNEKVKDDVVFDLTEIEAIVIGEPFKIWLIIRNESRGKRTIKVALSAHSVCSAEHSMIKKANGRVELMPNSQQEIDLTIDYKEYWKHLQEQCMIKMYAIARVAETGQTWTDEDDFQIEKPPMTIEAPRKMKRGESVEVLLSFTNPLHMDLTECQLSIDDSDIHFPRVIKFPHCAYGYGKFVYKFLFTPKIYGIKEIIVSFKSKELFDINGSLSIEVMK